jgi:hypothetical protein
MTEISVEPALQAKFAALDAPAAVSDAAGNPLAYIVPPTEYDRLRRVDEEHRRLVYAYAQTLFTDEELDEDERDTETVSTDELIRHLESL